MDVCHLSTHCSSGASKFYVTTLAVCMPLLLGAPEGRGSAWFSMAPARSWEWHKVCAQQSMAERMEAVGRACRNSHSNLAEVLDPAARALSWAGERQLGSVLPALGDPRLCLLAQPSSLAHC